MLVKIRMKIGLRNGVRFKFDNNIIEVGMIALTCHCKNISITVKKSPETVTQCNCSICSRYDALWGYYPPNQVAVVFDKQQSTTYRWGDGCIDFHHCPSCGCITHYTTTEKVEHKKTAVNFRLMNESERQFIPVRKFDGKKNWEYIDD